MLARFLLQATLMPRLVALLVIAALAGCLKTASVDCGGGVCPGGLDCVADPLRSGSTCTGFEDSGTCELCVLSTCGNGELDQGEACDDGNRVSGDGCPADCSAACGDGIVDPDEACDDGNVSGGDGCSADCRSNEQCGNNVMDPDEQCDDANQIDGDGCSLACAVESPTWTKVGAAPSARSLAASAFDPVRGKLVLFGGCVSDGPGCLADRDLRQDTWEWDGTTWTQRETSPPAVPTARMASTMAYDGARHKLVLFGGCSGAGGGMCDSLLADTWEWDGNSWSELHPPVSPPPRFGSAMVYDATRKRIVMFAGCGGVGDQTCGPQQALADTWEWDGASWQQMTTAQPPPARAFHALAFDAARGVVVMFGGGDALAARGDTWEWDGTGWTQRVIANAPPARNRHVLAYDAARGGTVLVGGCLGMPLAGMCMTPAADLWQWDGNRWTDRTPAFAPSPRWGHAAAFDSLRARLVVTTGSDGQGSPLADTWEWDGAAWLARGEVAFAPPGPNHAMAYDESFRSMILFGGDVSTTAAQTWAWDGSRWFSAPTTVTPAPRAGHVVAYDRGRGEVVMFGGRGPAGISDETWVWSGGWQLRSPPHRPPARENAAVAYDRVHSNVVVFGGQDSNGNALADTWLYDGSDWLQVTPASAPSARFGHTMAFDVARGRVELFGGLQTGPFPSAFADTWQWDGTTWTKATPTASPSARYGHAMAYDEKHGLTVVFGGCTSGGFQACASFDDATWTWDGTSWTQQTVVDRPVARMLHAIGYDSARGVVVIAGGASAQGFAGPLADTWEWDGTTWSKRSGSDAPPALGNQVLAYDSLRGVVVAFGGVTAGTVPSTEPGTTWEWNGERWVDRALTTAPRARQGHAMAYDASRHRVVLFGGNENGPTTFGDTWEYDGVGWVSRGQGPPARTNHSMAYDAAHHVVVLFGGYAYPTVFHDTWLWDGTQWSQAATGTSPPGGAGTMTFDARRGVVVWFGGTDFSGGNLAETWEWDGSAWQQRSPTQQPPSAGLLAYDDARGTSIMFGSSDNKTWEWDGTSWTQLPIINGPPMQAGSAISLAYDGARKQLVLYGASAATAITSDTWLFAFSSARAELSCATGFDLSGAEIVSCALDDCRGACGTCGNGTCDPVESCRTCPADCGACQTCGDLRCDQNETCAACPGDCCP